MVVVLSRYAKVQFCPSKMFRTPVTPHATNLLLSEITVWRLDTKAREAWLSSCQMSRHTESGHDCDDVDDTRVYCHNRTSPMSLGRNTIFRSFFRLGPKTAILAGFMAILWVRSAQTKPKIPKWTPPS